MRKRIAQLLAICLLELTGSVLVGAQEKPPTPAAQEKQAAARSAAQEKQAAARALAEQKRALAHEKRAAEGEKRVAAHEKRAEARMAAEQKLSMEEAIRQAVRADGTFKLLGTQLGGGMGKIIKGAPYSATAVTEHTQTLSDGNKIIQKNEATYYRDSDGRTRIDQKLKTIGKWTAAGDPPQIITISDPVAGNYYSLDPRTRTALMEARGPQKGPATPKEIFRPPGRMEISGPKGLKEIPGAKGPKGIVGPGGPNNPGGPRTPSFAKMPEPGQLVASQGPKNEKKKESLGIRVIEGVSADGTRSTLTIPAGEIGNVAPIEIIDENWYSPELQVPVMTSHHDPRSGDTIYRLTNINRSEPARSMFEVPSDYRIVDRRVPKPPTAPEPAKLAQPAKKPEDKL